MMDNALYYPHINFDNSSWVKSMALFYNRIYRIVPNGIRPKDPDDLGELLEDGTIGNSIDPVPYSKEASRKFIKRVGSWSAAALTFGQDEEQHFDRMHKDKIDEQVKRLFLSLGYGKTDQWVNVPTEMASNYMLFLAKEIAESNQLKLLTNQWAPWTATTYFSIDGSVDDLVMSYEIDNEEPFSLFALMIRQMTPFNIEEIPAKRIASFRKKRKDEMAEFRKALFELHAELSSLSDPRIRIDKIRDKIDQYKRARKQFQASADVIGAKGWFGVTLMGFPAPSLLGALFNIPYSSSAVLLASSLALGGIFSLANSKRDLQMLRKTNAISSIFELTENFSNYTTQRGGGDMNFHAYNCLEEYIND